LLSIKAPEKEAVAWVVVAIAIPKMERTMVAVAAVVWMAVAMVTTKKNRHPLHQKRGKSGQCESLLNTLLRR
jgi:hypothetical protein